MGHACSIMSPLTTKTVNLFDRLEWIFIQRQTTRESIESQIINHLQYQVQTGELNWFKVSWDDVEFGIMFKASDTTGPSAGWCGQVFDHLRYGIISVDAYNRAMKGI